MYETGPPTTPASALGLTTWNSESGLAASHRADFSLDVALHQLAIGDTEAVRQRYYTQLAPPTVTGCAR